MLSTHGFARVLWLARPPTATLEDIGLKMLEEDPEAEAVIEVYLRQFCPPSNQCPACGEQMENCFVASIGKLAGHGRCSICQWSFRGIHKIQLQRAYGPRWIRAGFNILLPFHPNTVGKARQNAINQARVKKIQQFG